MGTDNEFFHFVIATKDDKNLQLLFSLSNHFALPTIVLGKNEQRFQQWGDFNMKMKLYHDAVSSIVNQDAIVLLSDAFDFLPLADVATIIERFKACNCDVLYNGEYDLHPFWMGGEAMERTYRELFPKNNEKRYKYLNSGGIIGRAGALRAIFDTYSYTTQNDDQKYHHEVLFDVTRTQRIPYKLKVDVDNDLFFCASNSTWDLNLDSNGDFATGGGKHPILIHCNGTYHYTRVYFDAWNANKNIALTTYRF